MHLLALADTVSTCNTDFAERFAIDAAKSAMVKENLIGQTEDIMTENLDDCGLRFLLAMKHYGYLLRYVFRFIAIQKSTYIFKYCNFIHIFFSSFFLIENVL